MTYPDVTSLAAASPIAHVVDKPFVGWWVSNATVMLILASILTIWVMVTAAKRIATGNTGRSVDDFRAQGMLANFVEAICLYLRDGIFRPMLGEETDRFTPILWTFFWFILFCNLLGLVPLLDITAMLGINHGHGVGGTATQSIWVTGALALVAFLFYTGVALKRDAIGYFKHLTVGAPWYMWPIIVPVEILGTFIKPFALALRLFANMTGGHVLLAALFGFVGSLAAGLGTVGLGVGVFPLLGAVAIYMLEILVAFIQAFIFAFLTGLFLALLVAHEDHEHGESHGLQEETPHTLEEFAHTDPHVKIEPQK